MATTDEVRALRQALDRLIQFNDKELIERSDWGAINFQMARQDIEDSQSIAQSLSNLPLNHLTNRTIKRITDSIPSIIEVLQRIDDFSIVGEEAPAVHRDNICQELHNSVENFREHSTVQIPYLAYLKGDVSQNIDNLNSAVSDARKKLEAADVWIEQRKDNIDEMVRAAQEAAASVGVATFTQAFGDEAEGLEERAVIWLRAAFAFGVATILAALGLFFWPVLPDDAGAWKTLGNIFSKAAIIAILFTSTVWCGRVYRALQHQATVNKHRALSLRTFQAFVRAADDPYVRDAVLMEAAKTVFSGVPTGFVDQGGDKGPGVNFVEFGRSSAETAAKESTN